VEEIKAIASNVDEKMRTASRGATDASPGSLAVLAALLISEEFTDDEKEIAKLREEIDRLEEELKSAITEKDEASERARESSQEAESLREESEGELEDLKKKLKEVAKLNFDDLKSQFENALSIITGQVDLTDAVVSMTQNAGYIASREYYKALIEGSKENVTGLRKEYETGSFYTLRGADGRYISSSRGLYERSRLARYGVHAGAGGADEKV
jgi:cell division protein ZapA (FtsZ GTPase activity inhibitor)